MWYARVSGQWRSFKWLGLGLEKLSKAEGEVIVEWLPVEGSRNKQPVCRALKLCDGLGVSRVYWKEQAVELSRQKDGKPFAFDVQDRVRLGVVGRKGVGAEIGRVPSGSEDGGNLAKGEDSGKVDGSGREIVREEDGGKVAEVAGMVEGVARVVQPVLESLTPTKYILKFCNGCGKIAEFTPRAWKCRACSRVYNRQYYLRSRDQKRKPYPNPYK